MLERVKQRKSEEGFTLIELLIVIIILAILAAFVIFAVGTTTKNTTVAACNSTVKSTETAIGSFKAQTGTYPTTIATLTKKTIVGQTGTKVGPWLRATPPSNLTNGRKFAIVAGATTGLKKTGNITVLVKTPTTPAKTKKVTADTATSCKTA